MTAFAERSRWPDERIDDLAAEVTMLKGAPIRIATMTEQLRGMERDLNQLGELIRQIGSRVDQALTTLGDEEAEHRVEERTWTRTHQGRLHVQGAQQSAAMLVTAAVAIVALIIGLSGHG